VRVVEPPIEPGLDWTYPGDFSGRSVASIEWDRGVYREGALLAGYSRDLVGTVVRVKPRLPPLGSVVAGRATLGAIERAVFEVRDRDDRCLRRIEGPHREKREVVTVRTPDGAEVVTIGPRSKQGRLASRYDLRTEGRLIGYISGNMKAITNTDGVTMSRVLHVRGRSSEFAIETPLNDPLFSAAVVAAICQRIAAKTGTGVPAP
jgi:hypothetical protein